MRRFPTLSRKLDWQMQRYVYARFYRIKLRADGMLSPKVYARIYEKVSAAPDSDVIEIGSGRGAGTVVIATALKESGKAGKVVAVEKFEGGSNVGFGTRDENIRRVHTLFEQFGVDDRIAIFPDYLDSDNIEGLMSLVSGGPINCVVIDADGRLNVYLPALWQHMAERCVIVMDDYRESYDFRETSEQYPLGHTKELLCYRLVNKLVELGYLELEAVVDATVFARKSARGMISDRDRARLDDVAAGVKQEHTTWLRARATTTSPRSSG